MFIFDKVVRVFIVSHTCTSQGSTNYPSRDQNYFSVLNTVMSIDFGNT